MKYMNVYLNVIKIVYRISDHVMYKEKSSLKEARMEGYHKFIPRFLR